ncbi:LysE family translocator [Leptolyngbya sp. AN02str]|uniref:LysE family translocator n=1 Tax=Leptolyngbya sp. AN02str TaxID=3423363 RepID=UPI003D321102
MSFFLRGLVIGFSIAAPVGPIGILCIQRTLTHGRWVGLVSGLGAATADAIYGVIAGYGFTLISAILVGQTLWLRLFGGIFLIYLGVKTFRSKPAEHSAVATFDGMVSAYFSTVLLTLSNPATILAFVAVFAGLDLATASDPLRSNDAERFTAAVLVLGVFLGSALWWLLLSTGVSLVQSRFNSRRLRWLNRVSGIVLLGFGMVALLPWPLP